MCRNWWKCLKNLMTGDLCPINQAADITVRNEQKHWHQSDCLQSCAPWECCTRSHLLIIVATCFHTFNRPHSVISQKIGLVCQCWGCALWSKRHRSCSLVSWEFDCDSAPSHLSLILCKFLAKHSAHRTSSLCTRYGSLRIYSVP
jgi:hypothetical protein